MLTGPSDWRQVKLGDVAAQESNSFVDGPFGSNLKTTEYSDEGIRLIQLQNIGDGFWIDNNRKFIPPRKFEELKRHAAYPGDIVIAKMADPLARACLIPPVAERFVVVADCIRLAPDLSQYDPRYLVYAVNHRDVRSQAEQKSTGTTRERINLSKLKTLELWIPPLLEQRRISEILDAAEEAIRQAERLIAKLRAVKAGLLADLLTYGLDEHGHLRDPQAHPELFKDSPLGRIPREWGVSTIGDIAIHVGSGATPRGGNEVYKTEGVVFIRSQNVTFEGLLLDDVVYIDDDTHRTMGRSEVFPHDVLLNITGASIGRCCPLPKGLGVANVNQHVCAIRLPEPTHEGATFLSSVLASEIGQHQIHQLNAGGNRQGLNYEQLRSFIIPWPPLSERAGITRALDTHDARIRAEEATLAKLCQVKRGLMHDLLTGKVRVKV